MKSFVIFNVLPAAIMAMAVPDYVYYGASTAAPSTIRVCRKKTSYSVGSTVAPTNTVTTITTTTDGATSTITSTITSSSSEIITTTTETSTSTSTDAGTTTDIQTSTSTTSDLPGTSTTTTDSATSTCPITFVNPRCARDNCLRAIIACSAKPGPSVGLADCSSYASAAQQTITAGDPVTVTATETEITTIPGPGTATTITAGPTNTLVCLADNCVRAFLRFDSSASEFCATYTQTINTGTAIPSFALNCPTAAAALSSGCSCLSAITAATPRIAMAAENAPMATITSAPLLKKRQVLAAVPDYASSCSGSARYESACACLGVTAGTLTVPPATVTETVTTTLTAAV